MQIVGGGLVFFVVLVGLWQLLYHADITHVSDLLSAESLRIFFSDMFGSDAEHQTMTGREMGIFFSIFVVMQFWNLFNAKYFRTKNSLIGDIVDLFRNPQRVKESYNRYFLLILAVILGGQVAIVTFAGELFSVSPLSLGDWVWIMLLTSPVLVIPDIVRLVSRKR